MGKNDHRRRVTQLMFRQALTRLLRSKPLQSISVTELCQEAGVNRGTFYAHYTDLYDLRRQIEEELAVDFQAALSPLLLADGGDLTPLRITEGIFQCLRDNADVCAMTIGPNGDKEFAARLVSLGWEKYVESYRRCFSQTTARKLEYYYTFVSAGCIGVLEKWLSNGLTPDVGEVAAMVEGIMSRGIGFLDG